MDAHLPGSLYAPATRQFTMATGAFVEPGQRIALLADPSDVEALVRQLVRIGLDDVVGWIASEDFVAWRAGGGATASIARTTFREAGAPGEDSVWVDVRGAAEAASAHVPGALQIAQGRLALEIDRIPRGRPGDRPLCHWRTGRARERLSATARLRRPYVDDDFTRWRASK